MYQLSTITAPTFGPSHRAFGGTGSSSWREAFLSLLESILRDGEDKLVSVPYDSIRYYVGAHGALLNEIRRPQLVALDVGTADSVLVDERTGQVAGLLGFGNVVWGDPAMARVFAGASDAFWEGFGSCLVKSRNERIRQLLYAVYRSVVVVVTHYYRPQNGNDELEARRTLNWALNQLAGV